MAGRNELANAAETILIVDDDRAVRHSLKFRLEVDGFRVRTYASAADLLADDDLPASGCLVIDYKLPETDGLALLAELRRRKVTLPAVLITTAPTPLLRARAAAAGVEIIEKPLLTETLFNGIRKALAGARPGGA